MTKTVIVAQLQNEAVNLLALTKNGDEIIIEENNVPLARIVPFSIEDLNQELAAWEKASDKDFLNFEKELAESK